MSGEGRAIQRARSFRDKLLLPSTRIHFEHAVIIAGGIYREECQYPQWSRVFGSAGRAAVAVSGLAKRVDLRGYVSRAWADDVRASMLAFGISPNFADCDSEIAFEYFHALSRPNILPFPLPELPPIEVSGDLVVRFGMIEAAVKVASRVAVYDPQGAGRVEPFTQNGSTATERLAVVLNEAELLVGTRSTTILEAVTKIRNVDGPETIVLKRGASGALVIKADGSEVKIPAYESDTVFKIGSGDIFTSAFALYWGERQLEATAAAEMASRSVAHYVAARDPVLPEADSLLHGARTGGPFGRVYIAAPFFDMAQRWLVEEACLAFRSLGVEFFSPFHDVGMGRSVKETAEADLAGLGGCVSLVAFCDGGDPGTLFEVGYARSREIPVIVFASRMKESDLTMLKGSGCWVTDDFATAIYRAAWAARIP